MALAVDTAKPAGTSFSTTYGFHAPEERKLFPADAATSPAAAAATATAAAAAAATAASAAAAAAPRLLGLNSGLAGLGARRPGELRSSAPLHRGDRAHRSGALAGSLGVVPAVSLEDSVGWKGLVQMSRSTGGTGSLDWRRKPADADVSGHEAAIEVVATAHPSSAVRRLVRSVVRGLRACQEPEAPADGMGGTYFFPNEAGGKAAILKPCDEEPLAPNNPKGYVGRQLGDPGWKPTVRVGEAAMREVAAHLLDHGGFARVPTSVLVRARHSTFCYNAHDAAADADAGGGPCAGQSSAHLPMKLGSLQAFVPHTCDTSEMGPSRFAAADVHRIGILDIRLFNTDRHAGNMLVRSSKDASASSANLAVRVMADSPYELVPIDHGFCLPETLDAPYFEWLHWPQAMLPFSDDELAYIRSLDAAADRELLARELPVLRPECVRVLELTTALLQRCADAGMTLYEIGSIMSRPMYGGDEEPSELERMCGDAKAAHEMQQIDEDEDEGGADDESGQESGSEGDAFDVGGESDGERVGRRTQSAFAAAAPPAGSGLCAPAGLLSNGSLSDLYDEARETALAEELSRELSLELGCVGGRLGELAAPAMSPPAPKHLKLPAGCAASDASRAGSSEDDHDLLFELEHATEDASVCGGARRAARVLPGQLSAFSKGAQTSPTTFEVGSPGAFSVGSSVSSLECARATGGCGSGSMARDNGLLYEPTAPRAPAVAPLAVAASSVHGNNGLAARMMRRAKRASSRRRVRGATAVRPAHVGGASGATYPPPVLGAAGGISFSDFDANSWEVFKAEVLRRIDACIASGCWRKDAVSPQGGIATSCPRF